ncbi:MAG: DUF4145 domain-containing protein [Terricaulis sp.]
MGFKKELWSGSFEILPRWPCPSCSSGHLVSIEDAKFVRETVASKRLRASEEWEPEWVVERFSTGLQCSVCAEAAVVAGTITYGYEQFYDEDGDPSLEVVALYCPEILQPSPQIIDIPNTTPGEVVGEIERASSLIWLDEGSCANRLRAATELILTDLGVPRFTTNKHGSRVQLTLAARIDKLKTKHQTAAKLLHSLRWIGNVGSHGGLSGIARKDLLSAFEIMEHLLEKLFDNKEDRLVKTAADITRRKGKVPKLRRRKWMQKS